jgi:adenylate cyclase
VSTDFEAEGLLEGVTGEAREARARLLAELEQDGVPLADLRRAVEEGRIALLPVERVLSGAGRRYTPDEVAELAGVEREFLDRQWRALGLALAGDEAVYTERDVEAARRVAGLREAGLPDEGILEISRLLGMTMSQLAAANRSVIGGAFLGSADTEYEASRRLAAAAEAFLPIAVESLGYVLNLHLREQIRHDALAGGDELGGAAAAQRVAVCFADMVGFTQLGESLAPDELGALTGRFGELATGAIEPPARIVKLIGDAVMVVGPEPEGIVEAAFRLIEAAQAEGGEFPILRAGIAYGESFPRGGDWYGRPVNLASRITDRARPGSVLVSEEVRDALGDRYQWSFAGAKRLKGIDGETPVFRCRRLGDESSEAAAGGGLADSLVEAAGELLGAADGGAESSSAEVREPRGSRRRRARRS